ncbi:Forkhead box protein N4, partial [Stegodyphus mimosarum]
MDSMDIDSFKIQEMIELDMRSLGDYSNDIPCFPEPTSAMADALDSALDSDLSNGCNTWTYSSSNFLNSSIDLDSISGLLVNPQTALPVSMSESLILPTSVPSSLSNSCHDTSASGKDESTSLSTSGSITVTLPLQVITTNALVTEMADVQSHVNLTVAVPTPSPTPHNTGSSQAQQGSSVRDSETNRESSESPKPKSKGKNAKSNQQINIENAYPKPAYSYSCLIAMALKNSKTGSLPVNEIYDFMTENFPYFKTAPNGWK